MTTCLSLRGDVFLEQDVSLRGDAFLRGDVSLRGCNEYLIDGSLYMHPCGDTIPTCIYIYIHTHTYTHIRTHTNTYTHAHTHTHDAFPCTAGYEE